MLEEIRWDRPLLQRRGAPRRLGGLEVYYDFDWRTVFDHNRAAFPNGQSLATLVSRDCPPGKKATLLLTEIAGAVARIEETPTRYVVVIPIHDYLRSAGGDAASTYYARISGKPLTKLASLAEVRFSESEFLAFLDANLSQAELEGWVQESPERVQWIRELAAQNDEVRGSSEGRPRDVAKPTLLLDLLEAVSHSDPDSLHEAMKQLTATPTGRAAAVDAIADRLLYRIADTRNQLRRYQELVNRTGVSETEVQRLFEDHPWIVGLPYVGTRARVEIPRGVVDFVLDRYDGFFDIVELKGPDDRIVVEPSEVVGRPASASADNLGPALGKALAQSHLYRSILDDSRGLQKQYGLSDTRQPRILILVGRSADLSDAGRDILRQLNLSLHRVEVMPYDILGVRTEAILRNVEKLLESHSDVAVSTPQAIVSPGDQSGRRVR